MSGNPMTPQQFVAKWRGVQLSERASVQEHFLDLCALFGQPQRPAVCASLRPAPVMFGEHRNEAIAWLTRLEASTAPA